MPTFTLSFLGNAVTLAVVSELELDPEVFSAQERDRFLKIVA
jgi:hypothetical protein